VGALLAVLISLVFERFDRRLRAHEDVDALFALPMLGAIPAFRKLPKAIVKAGRLSASMPPVHALMNKAS
jgi:hypothetical protein